MLAKFLLRLAVIGGAVTASAAAHSADLAGYAGGSCLGYSQFALATQPVDVINQTLWANFENAKAGMSEPGVLASRQSSLLWAMQARWACSAAIGYLNGGHIDAETIQKCDCFHQRYVSLR
jgi:hypothetical protein